MATRPLTSRDNVMYVINYKHLTLVLAAVCNPDKQFRFMYHRYVIYYVYMPMNAKVAKVAQSTGSDSVAADDLNLVLDHHSFVPFYAQIVDHVRTLVTKNKLREGQVFCSEGDLARMLGISKMPVRQ